MLAPSDLRSTAPPSAELLAERFHDSPLGRALEAGLEAMWLRHQCQLEQEEEEQRRNQRWWCPGSTRRRRRHHPRSWLSQVRILNYRQFKTISKDVSSEAATGHCRPPPSELSQSACSMRRHDRPGLTRASSVSDGVCGSAVPVAHHQQPQLRRAGALLVSATSPSCIISLCSWSQV